MPLDMLPNPLLPIPSPVPIPLPIPIPPRPEPEELPKLPSEELPKEPRPELPEPRLLRPPLDNCPHAARGSLARAANKTAEIARVHRMTKSPRPVGYASA